MNPLLSYANFKDVKVSSNVMTLQGTINKTAILFFLTVVSACYTWYATKNGYENAGVTYATIGSIIGMILGIITCLKQAWAPVTAPAYALCEGLALGGISALYEVKTQGIAIQAVMLTLGTFAGMLFLFQNNVLRATPTFVRIIIGATFGIAIIYLLSAILSLLHINALTDVIRGGGPLGIAISVGAALVASFNLIIDFEFIKENSESASAPKYMEWYAAFGLMVTLIWIYLEILRLLSKLNRK